MRTRPLRSVTSIAPSGRNATDHGCCNPLVTTTTRRCRSSADSKLTLPSGRAGVSQRIGGGASPSYSSCGSSVCFRNCLAPLAMTAAGAATMAIPHLSDVQNFINLLLQKDVQPGFLYSSALLHASACSLSHLSSGPKHAPVFEPNWF